MNKLINLTNQPFAAEFFNQSLNKNRLVRSYLLTGRALKDKLELIKQLNLVLNCQENTQSSVLKAACKQCQNCRWIETNTHPRTPLILEPQGSIEGESETLNEETTPNTKRKKDEIDIAQARALVSELLQSSEYFRIVIVTDASLKVFGDKPANTLLKAIEEAKPNTLFMLLCESEDNVLNTIVSRSQTIHFNSTDITEYQETSHELYKDLKQWLESSAANSRLEQILKAEQLSEAEDEHLIEMLNLLQDEYANSNIDIKSANKIMVIENASSDLRRFVRKKAVLGQLLGSLK